jgi:hypothetical protein
MKNLTTLTNVKTLSSKSANKIKGGQLDVVVDNFKISDVVIDNFTVNTVNTTRKYNLVIK